MPEGPEVETIRRDIEPFLINKEIANVWINTNLLRQKSYHIDCKLFASQKVISLKRHGKLLWIDTNNQDCLLIRLGMTGKLHVNKKKDVLENHTHARILFEDDSELRYIDPRRFGSVTTTSAKYRDLELAKMGPDPFSWNPKDITQIIKRIQKSSRNIKSILLDQNIVAGIGNIYACEALFLAQINPEKKGTEIATDQLDKLLNYAQQVMELALSHRGTSFMSYVDGWGEKGSNFAHLHVFAKANNPCPVCQKPISKMTQSGRSTFYCTQCQL